MEVERKKEVDKPRERKGKEENMEIGGEAIQSYCTYIKRREEETRKIELKEICKAGRGR